MCRISCWKSGFYHQVDSFLGDCRSLDESPVNDYQAIVAPIPAFLVTAANGMVFGSFWGALISWIGALMGALTSFYIARLFGNVALTKIVRNKKIAESIRSAGKKKWDTVMAEVLCG